ncbi:MAG: hypothetical protein GY870_12420 [archaeon]|nr:hypothetical protein [archaeon]
MSNKPKILIITPLMDVPTVTSNLAVMELMSYAATKDNLDIDFLWSVGANRAMFNLKTSLKKYDGVIYYGHGKETKLHGAHMFWSIINSKNIEQLKGASISTMACLSARELGHIAIEKGVKAYIGTEEVYYAAFPEKERNYLKDWIDYTIIKDKALLDGKTFGEAYDLFQKRATQYLNIYKSNFNYRNYDWYYESTLHNLKHTKLIGDKHAKLYG